MSELLDDLLARIHAAEGDTTAIEVKSAAGGLPKSTIESLSALANLPGGGYIILGLDEGNEFAPVQLQNVQVLKQGLSNQARALAPPAVLTIQESESLEGLPLVVATVHECDLSDKPCKIVSTGQAFRRSYDGDHRLSEQEVTAFLRQRNANLSDREAIPGTSEDDLDSDIINLWRERLVDINDALTAFGPEEQLQRAGIITSGGEISRAGLLTFGKYPQTYMPRFVVNIADTRDATGKNRARNAQVITGSIPMMLHQTMNWFRANLDTWFVETDRGDVIEVSQYPLEVVREIIGNALVHRDLSGWSDGLAVEVRLQSDRLVVNNPGGLYGITVDRLGLEKTTSARNPRLVSLCVNVRHPTEQTRVIEALASGLVRVVAVLRERGLPPAQFFDYGVEFTVVVRPAVAPAAEGSLKAIVYPPGVTGDTQKAVYRALASEGQLTVGEIVAATNAKAGSVRSVLTRMRQSNLVTLLEGGRGKESIYSLTIPETQATKKS